MTVKKVNKQDLLSFMIWYTAYIGIFPIRTSMMIHVYPFSFNYSCPSDNEEKHQCYISVTAIPPVDPCDDCSQLAILHAQHGLYARVGRIADITVALVC